jgi:HlyD family secretion protein
MSGGVRMKLFWNVILVVSTVALLAGCAKNSEGSYQGYIEGEYVYVAAPLGGALTNLAVARGDSVKAGQLLFVLEREPEAAALAQAEQTLAQAQAQLADLTKGSRPSEIAALAAQLEGAKANLKLAESQFDRAQELGSSRVNSQDALDQARAQRDASQAQVDLLTADLETAKLGGRTDTVQAAQAAVEAQAAARDKAQWSFDQKQQFAPTNAVIHDTLYRAGEWVAAGNPVVVLLPPANLKVRFFIPQEMLPQMKVGQTVSVRFDGTTSVFNAVVNYISTQAEYTPPVIYSRETRANLVFMIEAKFAPADAANLRPGQPVDVRLN